MKNKAKQNIRKLKGKVKKIRDDMNIEITNER